MNDIPIFDSLTHPTLDDNWILPKYPESANIQQLLYDMKENNICKALAVGMKGIGGYDLKKYAKFLKPYSDKLLPVAFVDFNIFNDKKNIETYIKNAINLGYIAFKIHPRISKLRLDDPQLDCFLKIASKYNMPVLLCTYYFENSLLLTYNTIGVLNELLYNNQETKIILLHGGNVRLLEFMEIVRAYPNVLLDLSFTIGKYHGSSISNDIKFLFKQFDRRICIGTDHPEFNQKFLRQVFNEYSVDITEEKKRNIAYKNLENFIL